MSPGAVSSRWTDHLLSWETLRAKLSRLMSTANHAGHCLSSGESPRQTVFLDSEAREIAVQVARPQPSHPWPEGTPDCAGPRNRNPSLVCLVRVAAWAPVKLRSQSRLQNHRRTLLLNMWVLVRGRESALLYHVCGCSLHQVWGWCVLVVESVRICIWEPFPFS